MRVVCTLSVLFAIGCLAPDGAESFIIRDNLATEGNTCAFTASANAAVLSRGSLSLISNTPYIAHPMFESRIVAPEGRESLRTILVEGAEVTIDIGPIVSTNPDTGTSTIDSRIDTLTFTSLSSSSVAPNGGLGVGSIDLVSVEALSLIRTRVGTTSNQVAAQVIATVTAFGQYYGEEIEAAPWRYPVTVSNLAANIGLCGMLQQPPAFNPCNPFQDNGGVIACCDDGAGGLLCPAF